MSLKFSSPDDEPREVPPARPSPVFVYAGKLEDGTRVVRDGDGLLHALVPVRRVCPPDKTG